MTSTVKLIPAPEVASLLRQALGPKGWEDFLMVVRQDRYGGRGPTLLPHCKLKDKDGHWRPVYDIEDVKRFIREYRDANPGSRPGIPLLVIPVEIDPTDRRHWSVKRIAPGSATVHKV